MKRTVVVGSVCVGGLNRSQRKISGSRTITSGSIASGASIKAKFGRVYSYKWERGENQLSCFAHCRGWLVTKSTSKVSETTHANEIDASPTVMKFD